MSPPYLLDTSILIKYLRRDERAKELLLYLQGVIKPLISSITVTELMVGAKTKLEEKETRLFISQFKTVSVDEKTADIAATFIKKYPPLFGPKISRGVADALIAACAKVSNSTLLSLNTRQFGRVNSKDLSVIILKEKSKTWTDKI